MRRNYFKLIGEKPQKTNETTPRAPRRSGSDAASKEAEPEKKSGRQLARQKRSEKHHQQLDKLKELEDKKRLRKSHKRAMTTKTSHGQPKLGSQISVLLDKIRSRQEE